MKVSLTERRIGYQDEKEHPNEILEDRKRVGALRAKKKKKHYCTILFVHLINIEIFFSNIGH